MQRIVLGIAFLMGIAWAGTAQAQVVAFDCFPLDGAQTVPPSGSAGSGVGNAWLDNSTNTLSWNISWGGLTGVVTAAHFHGPALPGSGAGIQVTIPATPTGSAGTAVITGAQKADLLAGRWYVNVHTTTSSPGEIRGQVVNTGCVKRFECFPIDGAQTVPPSGSPGSGLGYAYLNMNTTRLDWHIAWSGLAGVETAAHFHGPANPGATAGVKQPIDHTSNPTKSSALLGPVNASDLAQILWYVNIHTTATPSGEIRGQVTNPGCPQWTDLGQGKPGTTGTSVLAGIGPLTGGSTVHLDLINAFPLSTTALVIGFSQLNAPFKGGTMVPFPDLLLQNLPTDATGGLSLSSTWPNGIPAGLSLYFQHWTNDPGAHANLSASNGLEGIAQ